MRNLKRTLAKLLATVMIVSSVMGSNVNAVTAYAQTSDETEDAVTVVTEETGADQEKEETPAAEQTEETPAAEEAKEEVKEETPAGEPTETPAGEQPETPAAEQTVETPAAETTEVAAEETVPEEAGKFITVYYEASEGGSVSVKSESIDMSLGQQQAVGTTAYASEGYKFLYWQTADQSAIMSFEATYRPMIWGAETEDITYVAVFEKTEAEVRELEFNQYVDVNGIRISLYAAKEVLPDDATLEVNPVSPALEENIKEAIDGQTEEEVVKTISFDINIKSESEGGYVQPEEGTVSVTFEQISVDNAEVSSVSVYHVEEAGNNVTAVEEVASAGEATDSIGFDAEHFSVYTLVVFNAAKTKISIPVAVVEKDGNKYLDIPSQAREISFPTVSSITPERLAEQIEAPEGYAFVGAEYKSGSKWYTITNFELLKTGNVTIVCGTSGSATVNYNQLKDRIRFVYEKVDTFTLRLNPNGGVLENGSPAPADQIPQSARMFNLPGVDEVEFSKPGYSFVGWSETSQETPWILTDNLGTNVRGVIYNDMYEMVAGKEKTLYAVWRKDGSQQGEITIAIKKEADIDAPYEPESYGGDSYYFLTSEEQVDLYEYFTTVQTTVGVNAVNEVLTDTFHTKAWGLLAKHRDARKYNDPNKYYIEWYVIKLQASDDAYHIDGVVRSKDKVLTLNYDENGATGGRLPAGHVGRKNNQGEASFTVRGNDNNLTRTGYTFAGWNTKADGTGDDYTGGNRITISENTILYAKWAPKGDTVYKIQHYLWDNVKNIANLKEEEAKTGYTGAQVKASPKEYEGYEYKAGFEFGVHKEVKSGVIAPDGSLVLKLYYEPRTDLSYTVRYLEQGTENAVAEAKTVGGQTFGAEVTENAIDVAGYNKVEPTSATITIGTEKNVITFYYTKRTDLSYTVKYLEQGTETEVAKAKTVEGQTFGAKVTESAIDVAGYNKVDPTSAMITIGTEKNVITFYYTKKPEIRLSVVEETRTKVYGNPDPEFKVKVEGLDGELTYKATLDRKMETGGNAGYNWEHTEFVGSYDIFVTSFAIKDAEDNDVTENYIIKNNGGVEVIFGTTPIGQLEITHRPVTIHGGSSSKTYDGTALTYNHAYVDEETPLVKFYNTDTSAWEQEKLESWVVAGSQTDPGTSENTVTSVLIRHNPDATKNYDITFKPGKLTVDPAPPVTPPGPGPTITPVTPPTPAPAPAPEAPEVLGAVREDVPLLVAAPEVVGEVLGAVRKTDTAQVLGSRRGKTGDENSMSSNYIILLLALAGLGFSLVGKRRNRA